MREERGRKTKVVDPIVFDNEIDAITLDLEKQRQMLDEAAQSVPTSDTTENLVDQTYTVASGKGYGNSSTQYFVTLLNGQDFQQTYGTYLVFSSCINFKAILNTEYFYPYEFRITGLVKKYKKQNSSNAMYYELLFTKIYSIETVSIPLKRPIHF